MSDTEKSANEIEALVMKAARGGGLPLGLAEDLAMASAFLDLDGLRECPCQSGAALSIPSALDRVAAGEGTQTVTAERTVVLAYVAVAEQQSGKKLTWQANETGAEFLAFEDRKPTPSITKGRREVPQSLLDHLNELAAKTVVPETDASRDAGAGAGLDDND